MGSMMMIDAANRNSHRGDRVQIVDVAMVLAAGKVASSVQVPSCLDELLDMAQEAVRLERFVQTNGRMDVLPTTRRFVPYLRKETVHGMSRDKIAVSQTEVVHFPYSCSVELGRFLERHVFVAVIVQDDSHAQLELSVTDFVRYLTLLRRLVELVTLVVDTNNQCEDDELLPIQHDLECRICFANENAIVLPCLHELCASCAKQWVGVHHDCPFCRQRYQNFNGMERNQWQIESWDVMEVEADIAIIQNRIQSFFIARLENRAVMWQTMEDFIRIGKSSYQVEVEDCFVLIHS